VLGLSTRVVKEKGGDNRCEETIATNRALNRTLRQLHLLSTFSFNLNPNNSSYFGDGPLTYLRKCSDMSLTYLSRLGESPNPTKMRTLQKAVASAAAIAVPMRLASLELVLEAGYDNFTIVLQNKGSPDAAKQSSADSPNTITSCGIISPLPRSKSVSMRKIVESAGKFVLPASRQDCLEFFAAYRILARWVPQVISGQSPTIKTDLNSVGRYHPALKPGRQHFTKNFVMLPVAVRLLSSPLETSVIIKQKLIEEVFESQIANQGTIGGVTVDSETFHNDLLWALRVARLVDLDENGLVLGGREMRVKRLIKNWLKEKGLERSRENLLDAFHAVAPDMAKHLYVVPRHASRFHAQKFAAQTLFKVCYKDGDDGGLHPFICYIVPSVHQCSNYFQILS